MKVLGIETSCDETAAAVVEDGTTILSSVVSSQVAVHHPFGGVVPELASRKHIEMIVPVVNEAIQKAGTTPTGIDAVVATQGPGLIGSLLVGFSFAKAFAFGLGIPWLAVNHLEAHINSVFFDPDPPGFPFVALLVSGGHTSIYHVTAYTQSTLMGQTRDDAAGEAFDKVAKILGLGYPGGQIIDQLAAQGNPQKILFPRAYLDKGSYDFSFSGLKTAVNRYVQTHPDDYQQQTADIVASFQEAVVEVLTNKLLQAALSKDCAHIAVVGGVAANSRLRASVRQAAAQKGLTVHMPPLALCGDNAVMVAAVGHHYLQAGKRSQLDEDVYSRAMLPAMDRHLSPPSVKR